MSGHSRGNTIVRANTAKLTVSAAAIRLRNVSGAKVTNNVVQGTARCVMTDGMLRIGKRYPVCGTVHDEALCIAPESEADEAKEYLLACMTIEPSYMPGIPLAADGGVHKRYGLAKG